jgi:hypothetical protein
VKFGVGGARNRVEYATERNGVREPVRTVRERRMLFNFKMGAGVERQLASRFSLSVHIDASYAMGGRFKAADASLSGALIYAGMALTWRAW